MIIIATVLVPKGFVVTCEAFDAFLNANNLNIESCSPDDIINGKFPSDIEEDIAQQVILNIKYFYKTKLHFVINKI